MMKHEFEALLGKSVTEAEYRVVEAVYRDYDVISNVHGKQQIVDMYEKMGVLGLYQIYKTLSSDPIIKKHRVDLFEEYDIDFDHHILNERPRTISQVFNDIRREFAEEYPDVYKHLEYFDVSCKYERDINSAFPIYRDYRWVAVFMVEGGSEGHYIHVEILKDEKRELMFLAKTLMGKEHAWEIVHALWEITQG